MRKYYLLMFLSGLLFSQRMQGQLFLEYGLGYGTYAMDDLKGLLKGNNSLSGVRVTDNFEGYLTHDFRMGYATKMGLDFGVLLGMMNTGGKQSLADYSGFYKEEIRSRALKTAPFCRYRFQLPSPKVISGVEISGGALFSRVTVEGEVKLPQVAVHEQEKTKLKGTNFFVSPALIGGYQVLPALAIQGRIGYEWSGAKGILRVDKKPTLLNADWSGLRVGVDIRVMFGK